ncbi:putative cell wall-binding protein [Catenulispora sp. GP43]|uniref:cell wall-binding repeat-containing protein n=1 Tax=Catenulispora sp. GP43 TaxID=3156263 RepID=UPI0035118A6F
MRNRHVSLAAAAVLSTFGGAILAIPAARADDAPATLYVDADTAACNDGNSGLVQAAPLCSVHAAMASSLLVPGGTVVVSGDKIGAVDVTRSGTPGLPITIKSGGSGSWVTVTGQHDVEIDGATAMPSGQPLGGDEIHVVDSQRIVLHQDGGRCCGVGAIHLTGTSDSVVDGVSASYAHQQVVIDGGSTRDVVENLATDEQSDVAEVTITDSPDNSVLNNTFFASTQTPVVISGTSTGTVVENNILSGTGDSADHPETVPAVSVDAAATTGTRIGYNIFDSAGLNGPAVSWAGTAYPSGAAFDASPAGTVGHDKDGDPQLSLNGFGWPHDLHLKLGSPAIDAGDGSVAPAHDNDGLARIDDPRVTDTGGGSPTFTDIGAYEYHTQPFALSISGSGGLSPSNYRTVTVKAQTSGGWYPDTPTSVDVSIDGGPAKQVNGVGGGSYTVSLPEGLHTLSASATDAGGATATSTSQVFVRPTVFTPLLSVTPVPNGGGLVDIELGGVSPTSDFSLSMGDGRAPVTGVGLPYTTNGFNWQGQYQYQKSGTYHLTLNATDANGWSGTARADITVTVAPPVVPPAQPVVTVHRVAGSDRYSTAVAVSQAQWSAGSAGAVVLASGLGFPDALAGVPLAAHVHGPLLLTDPHKLDAATLAEINRVFGSGGKTIYVLGGTSAVSDAVLAQLPSTVHVERIGGVDRFDTARRIAAHIGSAADIVVADGASFPDALTAGPLAAKEHTAIVLSNGPVLDPQTAALVAGHKSVTAVGGPAATAVRADANLAHIPLTDLHGADRYATSHLVFDAINANYAPKQMGVASGTSFPDALTGGAFMANASQPLVLADPRLADGSPWLMSDLRDEVEEVYGDAGHISVFGGPGAVDERIVKDMVLWTQGREE